MFSSRLQELRKARGLTQKSMSEIIGIKLPTLAQYEKGNREPNYQTLIKLADFFGVSIDYLLDRTSEPWYIAELTTRYGLSRESLAFLERLNTPLNITVEEQEQIKQKQANYKNLLETLLNRDSEALKRMNNARLTAEEDYMCREITQNKYNRCASQILNNLLSLRTGHLWHTIGFDLFIALHEYCNNEDLDIGDIDKWLSLHRDKLQGDPESTS